MGGGDHYTAHSFKTVPFYNFVKVLNVYESADSAECNTIYMSEFDGDCEGHSLNEDMLMLETAGGTLTMSSELLDHRFRPANPIFEDLSVWEFFEQTEKTKKVTGENITNLYEQEDGECDNGPVPLPSGHPRQP